MLKLCLSWLRRMAALGVLLASAGGLFFMVAKWQQQFWVQSQRVNFEHLPPDRVLAAVRALADQGSHTLPALAVALGSTQASVAISAQQVVLEELERLESQSDSRSAQGRVLLAESLAKHSPEFGPTASRFAAYLAERLLRGNVDKLSSDDRWRLIDACGVVMQAATRHVDVARLARTIDLNWHETPPPIPWEETIALVRASEALRAAQLSAGAAGGGMEPAGVVVPGLPESACEDLLARESDSSANSAGLAPKPLPELTGESASETYERPEKFRKPLELRRLQKKGDAEAAARADSLTPDTADNLKDHGSLSPGESAVRKSLPTRSGSRRSGGPPRDETVIQLLQDLVAADEQAANRAATALAERGLPTQHLELAKRLADPDPAVRKSLIDILPRTAGLDARPWLLWLAHDDHADVRFAAMSMIATSQDPRLCEQIEQLARQDYDERILRLADRLVQRRNKK